MAAFADHFSGSARGYAAYRPTYPDALFSWLAEHSPGRGAVWDCGTGSGQAATALAYSASTRVAGSAGSDTPRLRSRPFRMFSTGSACNVPAQNVPAQNGLVQNVPGYAPPSSSRFCPVM